MFWETRDSDDDLNPFLIDKDQVYRFIDIFRLADDVYSELNTRAIILVLCDRDFETVVSYVGALRKKLVPILIQKEVSDDIISDWLTEYQIDYIVGESRHLFREYSVIGKIGDCLIFKTSRKTKKIINPKLTLLMPTSGSTGHSKFVKTSTANLTEVTKSIVRYLEFDKTRVSISSLPFHYTFGLSVLNCTLEARSCLVLTNKSWIDKKFWALVEEYGVTDLSGVPFMFNVLRRFNMSDAILKNLKCVNQAGGRLEQKYTEYFLRYFSQHDIKFFTMYGATEASPRMSYVPPEKGLAKLGSVGIAIDIGRFYTDAADGRSEGELIYEGANVCLGYATNYQDLMKGDENGGVLATGDVATIDEDGFVTLIGRKKRFIKVCGISVNLDSLEEIVRAEYDCSVVIGIDDKVQILVQTNVLDEDELKRKIMHKIMVPKNNVSVSKISEIYMNSAGKPDYPRLIEEFLR